jgi:hypothetical protein
MSIDKNILEVQFKYKMHSYKFTALVLNTSKYLEIEKEVLFYDFISKIVWNITYDTSWKSAYNDRKPQRTISTHHRCPTLFRQYRSFDGLLGVFPPKGFENYGHLLQIGHIFDDQKHSLTPVLKGLPQDTYL